MDNKLFSLVQHFCDTLIAHQELAEPSWRGGIRCPECRTIHGRCGDAIFPLYYMYTMTGKSKYATSARLLADYMRVLQQPDGSWLNESAGEWKGTTVFQLLSLCHAYDLLLKKGEQQEAETLLDMIEPAARWVSRVFGNGGKTNVNYYITSALVLLWASRIVDDSHYAAQAGELIKRYGLGQLTADGFLLGEKTAQRPFSRITGTVDIGYNLDMSLGAMAEYALMTGDAELKQRTVHALRKHLEMMYPDGSIDNSFGSRNYKWTLFGSKTAHGCQMAFLMLCGEDPAFYKAAELNADYLQKSMKAGRGMPGYGPHYKELFAQGCIHSVFNRADALAAALVYGQTPAQQDAVIPSQRVFGVKEHATIGVYHMRSHDWMGTVSCYHVYHAPAGGTISYLWHAKAGPVQLGSATKYERYEPYNMPAYPAASEQLITPRIEAVRQGMTCSNLYEYDAAASICANTAQPELEASGRLKYEADGARYDCGISYRIRYLFHESFVEKRYDVNVLMSCEQLAITEPIVSGANPVVSVEGETIGIPAGEAGVISVSGSGAGFELDGESLTKTAVSVFPSVIAVPLRWRTGPLPPGAYSFRVTIRLES
ncbi:hypothetical protein EYB31_12280 [Paenibacillus thalictri]|uniref:Uncharacterized protein n=1 Tax=Paenibacillus thalictri TaxID=2527873 RepID=A0A4Q9DQT6_9BACL|nr:hypothetical protein EYB31_12280 [Paenibacillus thalictri]